MERCILAKGQVDGGISNHRITQDWEIYDLSAISNSPPTFHTHPVLNYQYKSIFFFNHLR
jgi:hypothetical protein